MSFGSGRQGSLPANLRDSVVLFKAAGNIGVPLDKLMSDLKSDGKVAGFLVRRHDDR